MSSQTKTGLFPTTFAVGHFAVWVLLVVARPPLPIEYFQARDARIVRAEGGTASFHLISDVDPLLIVAERGFGYISPWEPDRLGTIALLANLPAAILSQLIPVGSVEPTAGGMGWRKASWVQTAAFACLSTLQWAFVGAAVAAARQGRKMRQGAA